MYYFYNVPPGAYQLEIWTGGPFPLAYPVVVYAVPLSDILPIALPF